MGMTNDYLEQRFAQACEKLDEPEYAPSRYFDEFVSSVNRFRNLCIFAAGTSGKFCASMLAEQGYRVDFFCDNSDERWGKLYCGIRCISPQELSRLDGGVTIVVATMYHDEIIPQLHNLGITHVYMLDHILFPQRTLLNRSFYNDNKAKISQVYSMLEDEQSKLVFIKRLEFLTSPTDGFSWEEIASPHEKQYFDPEVISLSNHEILLDGGAYDGDTLRSFLGATRGTFDGVYAFELDPQNFFLLKNTIASLPVELQAKIQPFCMGLYKGKESFRIASSSTNSTIISSATSSDEDVRMAYVTSIDEALGTPVTFIKMDIEGAELDALIGAEKTIIRDEPKLAICVYHKIDDLWTIPLCIKRFVPGYRLYMRHYTVANNETVLYALPG